MKKMIFAAMAVLSLGLFSFTMPTTPQIWQDTEGNFTIEDGATASFSESDKQTVTELLKKIYNVDAGTSFDVAMLPNQSGKSVLDKTMLFWIMHSKCTKAGKVDIIPGSDEYQLMMIISKYAQPAQ